MGCGASKDDVANSSEHQNKYRVLKRKINWAEINSKLATEKTNDAKQKRLDLFIKMDKNENGFLSLEEIEKVLIKEVLSEAQQVFDLKPIIARSFQKAKSLNPVGRSKGGDNQIEKNEFRMLLIYLKNFMAIWEIFAKANDADDRRIDRVRFRGIFPRVQEWAPQFLSGDECWDAMMAQAVTGEGGGNLILFTDFAFWVLEREIGSYIENPEDE